MDKLPSYFSKTPSNLEKDEEIITNNDVLELLKETKNIEDDIQDLNFLDLSFMMKLENKIFNTIVAKITEKNFNNTICLFQPGDQFIPLSVTGKDCELQCEHCNKKYLQDMKDISSEKLLRDNLDALIAKNAQGCLISGGSDENGKVPFLRFKDILIEYKKKSDLIFNFHTGILNENDVKELSEIEPDVVSFDLTLDDDIIKNIQIRK